MLNTLIVVQCKQNIYCFSNSLSFQKSSDPEIKAKVKGLASQALDRAEELKGINKIGALSINEPARPCKNLVIVTLCKFFLVDFPYHLY